MNITKLKILFTIMILGLFFFRSANASAQFGAFDCGAILKYKNIQDSQESVTDWINGALTGLDFAKGALSSKSNIPSPDSRYFWVINYCEQNPLSNISDAAIKLYLEIIK